MQTHAELLDKFSGAMNEYLSRLENRNLQPTTIKNYSDVLHLFRNFLIFSEADDIFSAVEGWKEHMINVNKNTPSTVKQRLVMLKIFFAKAGKKTFPEQYRFPENPVDMDDAPKVIIKPYDELLTDEQTIKLFSPTPPKGVIRGNWPRNFAMLMLLVNEKIRNDELLSLALSDVDFEHHELTVRSGKGRKQRILDLSELSEQAIIFYIGSGIRPQSAGDNDFLFGTTSAKVFGAPNKLNDGANWHKGSGQWLSEVTRRTVLAITGVDNIRSHDCRHIGSRIELNAGATVEELQSELGHSSIALVELYAGRLQQRRRRESAKLILAARREAAEELRTINEYKSTKKRA